MTAPVDLGNDHGGSMLRTLAGKSRSAIVWTRSRLTAHWWLRACNAVGANTRTFWRPHVENRGRIVIGSRVRINSHWAPVALVTGPKGLIEIADGVYINYGTLISAHSSVYIGADVMVGNYSIIGDTEVPGIDEPRVAPALDARPIHIGAGAWLAARVTVLPGARIGAGAVIAAGSVVAGDIPPNAVAGGIPARLLREPSRQAAAAPDQPAPTLPRD
jgi:carbonic anhydrase/acetyltransferase-like protein (isoleucine patch superfamily)